MENIYIIEKNLFESDAPIFCHSVNCLGVMGSGVAKSVREIFPDVYEQYREICVKNKYLRLLGNTAIIKSDNRYIANMFAQERFGYDGKRITLLMDIESADKKFNLRLEEMLNDDGYDFVHDIQGIIDNINRDSFPATDFGLFIPRFAGKYAN